MESHLHPKTQRLREVLELRNSTPAPIQRYGQLAEDFFGKQAGRMDRGAVETYLLALKKGGASANYLRWNFSALRAIFQALEKPWPFNRRDIPKGEEPKRPHFRMEEVEALIRAAQQMGARECALVRVAAITGCRRIELSRMNRADIEKGSVLIRTAKRGSRRARPLDPATLRAVNAWLGTRKDRNPALWVGGMDSAGRFIPNGSRLSPNGVSNVFAEIRKAAGKGSKGAGIHALRRGLVTLLRREGMSEAEIRDLMGWAEGSPMVGVYSRLEPGEAEGHLKAVHPFFRRGR